MKTLPRNNLIALDSTILLALGSGDEGTIGVLRELLECGNYLLATQSSLVELGYIHLHQLKPRDLWMAADRVLKDMASYGIVPVKLAPLVNAQVEILAPKLAKVIKEGSGASNDLNLLDATLLVECSALGASILLTWSKNLIEFNFVGAGACLLLEHDMKPVSILAPSRLSEMHP